jgi:hypothetical protein
MPIYSGNSTVNTSITSNTISSYIPEEFNEYSATRNSISPTLMFNFVNSQFLDPRITFTRASSATFLNSAGKITTAAVDTPRFDYNPTTLACNGLLMESQQTNLLEYSSAIGGTTWYYNGGTGPTITLNAATAPDGSNTASLYIPGTASGFYDAAKNPLLLDNTQYTLSVWVKLYRSYYSIIHLQVGNNGAGGGFTNAWIQLTGGGTVLSTSNSGTASGSNASVTAYPNGWYRCTLSGISSIGATVTGSFVTIRPSNSNGDNNINVGDGTSGYYFWGAQLEQNLYVTSYIPTTSSTATRAADYSTLAYSVNPNGFTIVSKIFFPITNVGLGGLGEGLFAVRDSTVAYGFRVYRAGSTLTLKIATFGSITTASNAEQNMSSLGVSVIYGLVFTPTSLFTILNGGTISTTSVTGTIGAPTSIDIGNVDSGQQLGGYVQNLIYYPVALTATELQSLTS